MIFSEFTDLCNNHHNPFLNISITPKGSSCSSVVLRFLLWPQAIANVLSIPIDVPFLEVLCKWNHTSVCVEGPSCTYLAFLFSPEVYDAFPRAFNTSTSCLCTLFFPICNQSSQLRSQSHFF